MLPCSPLPSSPRPWLSCRPRPRRPGSRPAPSGRPSSRRSPGGSPSTRPATPWPCGRPRTAARTSSGPPAGPPAARGEHPSRCRHPAPPPCSRRWCWRTTAPRPRCGSARPGCSPSACRARPGAPRESGARPWTSRAAAESATGPRWGCFRTGERSSCGRASSPGRGTRPRPSAHRAGPGRPRQHLAPGHDRLGTARTRRGRRRERHRGVDALRRRAQHHRDDDQEPRRRPGARSSRCRRWARTPSSPASPSIRRAWPRQCGPGSTAPATSPSRAPARRLAGSGPHR